MQRQATAAGQYWLDLFMRYVTETHAKWAVIAAVSGLDIAWAYVLGVTILPTTLPLIVFVGGISVVYSFWRPEPRIAELASAIAELAASLSAVALLTYLVAASPIPFRDDLFAKIDAAMGLDWVAIFDWTMLHPYVYSTLSFAYWSLNTQIAFLLIFLTVTRRLDRLREFTFIFVISLAACGLISALVPAESAWAYYNVATRIDAYHLPHLAALRGGTMREIVMGRMLGIITFPSFHAALAVMLIWATRGMRYLFPVSVLLNGAMILATPVIGGHYFVDVPFGILIAALAFCARRCFPAQG